MGGDIPARGAYRQLLEDKVGGTRVPASENAKRLWPQHVRRPGDEHLSDTECFLKEALHEFLEGWERIPSHCSPDRAPDSTGDWRCEKCHKAMELLALIETNV